MSFDLILKPQCGGCGSATELYGSNCKHMTLCLSCGRSMAENHRTCYDCGAPITRLIREYHVRACPANDKNFFIGRFMTGLPNFSKKKSAENKWALHKEGLQGRQITDSLREKYKNKPWLLEDETGQSQYNGQLEGSQSATYYLLMPQGKDFVAVPAGSWYNFNKVAQYKQLTLEEAEEKMMNRRKTADGYQRWMMKASNTGPSAFGGVEKLDERDGIVGAGGRGRKKTGDDDEGNVSDKGEEDEEDEVARRNRQGLNKKDGEDEDEDFRGSDLDFDDDDDIEKGDDWEHEEIFTDDDEDVAIDPEEREDLAPEVPAPPEIKQDEEDEDETNEEEGGLSKSGKELKKLLGRSGGLNDSDADDDDDDDEMEEDISASPPLTSKQKDGPKEEPVDNSPIKPASVGPSRGTSSNVKSAKGKRKANGDDAKPASSASIKKTKTENESKSSVKDETSIKSSHPSKETSSSPAGRVTEGEIKAVLLQKAPMTTQDLVAKFRERLKTPEEKAAFANVLKKISKIQKTMGNSYIVLREK